ncbi:MAG: hypothetical protein GTO46_10820 [Gemmatimonadetes bacterium]|nr:hypothetical protein [Gemmatimonadota bacterium]NIO32096.1 hypothetical protein [Gemmatimonadota bacterium]
MTVGRITPYELAFGEERFAAHAFPALADEGERRGVSTWRYDRFTQLERVAALLEQVLPDNAEPGAVEQHLRILYHSYHFWSAGCPIYAFEAPVLRSLIEVPPDLREWSLSAPAPSLYIELPKNLFWAQVTEPGPPEPVEGMFAAREADRPEAEADILVVLGVRTDRPGFSVAGLRLGPGQAHQLVEPAQFQSDIPGAEQAGLYSLQRHSEAAALALRTLWYLDAYPASCEAVEGSGGRATDEHGAVTALRHFRVSLIERSDG